MKTFGPDHIYSILDTNKQYRDYDSDAACWSMTIYGVGALLLFYGTTQNIRIGLPLLAVWLILPFVYLDVRQRYDRWYVGRYVGPITCLVSTTELKPAETFNVVLAQTFRRALTIEYMTLELLMHEQRSGYDNYYRDEVIQTFSQEDQPVEAGQIYKTNISFRIPRDARPSSRNDDYRAEVSWLIRVILKCKNVDALTTEYLITVIDGDPPP